MQKLPGRLECEWYDLGGEGVAYHDLDSVNNGSGKLNPANGTYLNEFRIHESVDISYTKSRGIDDNPYNQVNPELNQLYVGWTEPGEWINYTLKVQQTGDYRVSIMYTANQDGMISIDVDGRETGAPIRIPATYNAQDTIAWRQWHHWNKLESATEIPLTKGVHLLTMRIVKIGNMNFDYLDFKLK